MLHTTHLQFVCWIVNPYPNPYVIYLRQFFNITFNLLMVSEAKQTDLPYHGSYLV